MKKNGFTFVELLVVITIIAVLFAVGVVSYTAISKNSRNARRISDLEAIRQALEMCRSIDGSYPASIYNPTSIVCPGASAVVTLNNTPRDPKCVVDTYTYTKDVPTVGGYTLTATCYENTPKSVFNP